MALDRNTVDRTAAAHIRQMQRLGPLSESQRETVRKLHERIARKVDARRRA